MGSFPRSILACGYLFYRDIYLQIPFSNWDGKFQITCLFRNITSIPHLLYKANHHESLTLDPKAKSWLERNLDSRNTKPWGGGMLYCHLTHVPNTYLIEVERVRAQSYSSGLQAYSSPLVLRWGSWGVRAMAILGWATTHQPASQTRNLNSFLPHPRYLCRTCDTGQLTLSQEESSRGILESTKDQLVNPRPWETSLWSDKLV